MTIELVESNRPAACIYSGLGSAIPVSAGQSLKIETSPGGQELLDAQCPTGKQWSAHIFLKIVESDQE